VVWTDTCPVDEVLDRKFVGAPGFRRGETVQYGKLGVFKVRQTHDGLWRRATRFLHFSAGSIPVRRLMTVRGARIKPCVGDGDDVFTRSILLGPKKRDESGIAPVGTGQSSRPSVGRPEQAAGKLPASAPKSCQASQTGVIEARGRWARGMFVVQPLSYKRSFVQHDESVNFVGLIRWSKPSCGLG
jgi:hypothetical protein